MSSWGGGQRAHRPGQPPCRPSNYLVQFRALQPPVCRTEAAQGPLDKGSAFCQGWELLTQLQGKRREGQKADSRSGLSRGCRCRLGAIT
jgi:hypothetical protein